MRPVRHYYCICSHYSIIRIVSISHEYVCVLYGHSKLNKQRKRKEKLVKYREIYKNDEGKKANISSCNDSELETKVQTQCPTAN